MDEELDLELEDPMTNYLEELSLKEEERKREHFSEEYRKLYNEVSTLCIELWGRDYTDVFGDSEFESLFSLKEKASYLKEQLDLHEKATDEERQREYEQAFPYRLKRKWKKAFGIAVKSQPMFSELYYYYFLGQWFRDKHFVMNDKEEDLRIHLTVIAPSGIGKSESNNFVSSMAEKARLRAKIVGRINDASIIGSYSSEREMFNSKTKKNEGDEDYLDPEQPGILSKFNFVIFDEGELVLRTMGSTEKLQNTLQATMNRHGSAANLVSNDLIGGGVAYYPNCSICITSYYLDEFRETLINRGLIQRTLLYVRENDRDLRREIEDLSIRSIWTTDHEGVRENQLEKCMVEFLEELNKVQVKENTIKIKPEVVDRIISYKEEMRKAGTLPRGQENIFDSIITREVIKMIKISALNALSEGRSEVTLQDVEDMYKLFKVTNIGVLDFIQENIETILDAKLEEYLKDMKTKLGTKPHPKGQVNDIMKTTWGISVPATIARIKKLKNYFDIYSEKGVKMIKIKQM